LPATASDIPAFNEGPDVHHGMAIGYSPDLIARLKNDHQILLKTFGLVGQAYARNDLPEVARQLRDFHHGLLGHLMTENIKLYVYLGGTIKHTDPESHELMLEFRQEMYGIGKAVLAFLNKYKEIDAHPALAETFGDDMKNIGAALVSRIRREEDTLYPLYAPIH
jgi:regulator of sigma D